MLQHCQQHYSHTRHELWIIKKNLFMTDTCQARSLRKTPIIIEALIERCGF